MIGRVWKLSNLGFSEHERLLLLNKKGLSYYRRIPDDFKEHEMKSDNLRSEKPKKSIPIAKIMSIEEIDEADRKTNKKFYDNGAAVFKVIFEKKSITSGRIEGITDTSEEDENKPTPVV